MTFWLWLGATHLSAALFGAGVVLMLQERRRAMRQAREQAVRPSMHADCLSATHDEKRRYAEFRRRIDEDVRGVVEKADREV